MKAVFHTLLGCGLLAASCAAADPGAEAGAAPFQPGEISIGEPLRLPARRDAASAASAPQPGSPAPFAATAPDPVPRGPGNGWIGLTVDDTLVTGRLVVVDVAAAGPADRAGIRVRDQLLAIDGGPLSSADQLAAALAAISPGSTVKVAIGRGDRLDELVLEARPRPTQPAAREWRQAAPLEPRRPPVRGPVSAAPTPTPDPGPASPAAPAGRGRTALGVRTLPVDESVAARFNLAAPAGALVIGVVHDLPASKAGVPPGSVIVAFDDRPVRSPTELTEIVTRGPVGRPVTLRYVLPGGEARRAEVSLQSLEVPLERALVGPEP